jgi:HNH endonuclease
MREKSELRFLRSIKTGRGLIKLVHSLRKIRRETNVKDPKRLSLTPAQRKLVLAKTNSRCHICGVEIKLNNFHADHVKTHSSGGVHEESNYLPSCQTCNSYRWHFSPEELQIILKLGVWVKGQLLRNSQLGQDIAKEFVKHEMRLRKQRVSK